MPQFHKFVHIVAFLAKQKDSLATHCLALFSGGGPNWLDYGGLRTVERFGFSDQPADIATGSRARRGTVRAQAARDGIEPCR